MSESFLHYVWQLQYFNKANLRTTTGERIIIFTPGHLNSHAGPDFLQARIRIGEVEWIGSVEIHIDASGWTLHNHQKDAAYDNVILHVVWSNDREVRRADGTLMPTMELKHRVDDALLLNMKRLVNSPEEIPCAPSWSSIPDLEKLGMLDKALTIRLEAKAAEILQRLDQNKGDWEETTYQVIARNFGFKVNAEPFLQLSRSVPLKILRRHADKVIQIEALLFGQSGLLEKTRSEDDYHSLLLREYNLLSKKYNLRERRMNHAQWKLLRLRPSNFPVLRIAQLAMLLYSEKNLFSKLINALQYNSLRQIFAISQSAYWLNHYQFARRSKTPFNGMGDESINNIIINSVVPLFVAYGKFKDDYVLIDRAMLTLQQIQSESNAITRRWSKLDFRSRSAFDSQAMIELYNNFCSRRRCLDCNMGASLLKPVSK